MTPRTRPLATPEEVVEIVRTVHANPEEWVQSVGVRGVDVRPDRLVVVVWSGSAFHTIGNDAAIVSRLSPSARLYSRGRGHPLTAWVRHPRRVAEAAKRSGLLVAFAVPEWVDGISADHPIGMLRGSDWRRQFREVVLNGANFMLYGV